MKSLGQQLARAKMRRASKKQAYERNVAKLVAERQQHELTMLPEVQRMSREATERSRKAIIVALRDSNMEPQWLKVDDDPWWPFLMQKLWRVDDEGQVYTYDFDDKGRRLSLHRLLVRKLRAKVQHINGDSWDFRSVNLQPEARAPRGVGKKEHNYSWNKRVSLSGNDIGYDCNGKVLIVNEGHQPDQWYYSKVWKKKLRF